MTDKRIYVIFTAARGKNSHGSLFANSEEGEWMVFILEEKRRFPRVKLQTPLRFQRLGRPEFVQAITDNLSLGGIGFVSDNFIPPATPLSLEVNVLSKVLNLTGRVAWSSPLPHSDRYRSGVEFTNINDKQKLAVADYIETQLVKP